jgi:hypothetical protein
MLNWLDPTIDADDKFSPVMDIKVWLDPTIDAIDRFSPQLNVA